MALEKSRRTDPEQLIALARAGDRDALGELLLSYRPYLSMLARLKTANVMQAKFDDSDLVQEACLAAHHDFGQFQGTTEPELTAWLRVILAHVAVNQARYHLRQRRDVRLEQQWQSQLDESSNLLERSFVHPGPSPSHGAMHRERAVMLADALSQLPSDYREVLVMRELEGKTLSEVAQRMERSPDAVQKLWARALVKMRRQMQLSLEST